jgi:glycosyltransferase involved in cell wall biosynthesis
MRVAIAGQTYYPATNGQSAFVVHLAEGLAELGHQVLILIPSERGGAYQLIRNQVDIRGLPAVSLSFLHPDQTSLALEPLSPTRDILEEFRPEIVHVQDPYPVSRAAARVARERGIHLVGTNHFDPGNVVPYLPVGRLAASFGAGFVALGPGSVQSPRGGRYPLQNGRRNHSPPRIEGTRLPHFVRR